MLPRNIFEGARGDLLYIRKQMIERQSKPMPLQIYYSRLSEKKYGTKVGVYVSQIYLTDKNAYSLPQWIAIVTLLNSMMEFILTNMIGSDGKFKFPSIWKWLKVIGFFKDWITAFIGVFTNRQPELKAKLMPMPRGRNFRIPKSISEIPPKV